MEKAPVWNEGKLAGGFKHFLFSPLSLGKIHILTTIFQMGRNHPPEKHWYIETAFLMHPRKMKLEPERIIGSQDLDLLKVELP